MGLRQIAIHAWSWLNYKPVYSDAMGMPNRRAFPEAQAMWVPAEDERRLAAYKLLSAYDHNQAAEIAEVVDGAGARDRREFGDPSMFIDTLVANVLGRDQKIVVPGAEQTTAGETGTASVAMAERVQDLLRDWAKAELLPMRLQQCERKTVALGDGVYRMAWDPAKKRPTLRVTDPGFYFPVIGEDDDGGEYPRRVHFAWELPADPKRGLEARLRRITYELDWIRPLTVAGVDETGTRAVRALPPAPESDPDAADTEPAGPTLTPGDILEPESGAIARQYAWNDEPSYFTCYLTDATWIIGDLKGNIDVDSSLPPAPRTQPGPTAKSSTTLTSSSTSSRSSTSRTRCRQPRSTGGSRRWRRRCRSSTSSPAPTPTPHGRPRRPGCPCWPCPASPTRDRNWPPAPAWSSSWVRTGSSPPSTRPAPWPNSATTSPTSRTGRRPSCGFPPCPWAPSPRPKSPAASPCRSASARSTPSSAACASPANTKSP